MNLRRTLTYFNIAVAVVLVGALVTVYWYAWRPLSETSGTLTAPVSRPASVVRDRLGVPHIHAGGLDDALILQGFVMAQDRLWQMDMLRRVAAGRVSEVAGAVGIQADREARRLRLERLAVQHAAALAAPDREALAAFARGVNFFLETHADRLPVEFAALGYRPAPWRIADTILVGLQMFRTLSTTWDGEIGKRTLLAGGDRAKVEFLFPLRAGGEVQFGSNAWVLAGSRTASGRPLLANDPHLEYSIPGIWYAVHLQAPGLNVSGVALPGVPGVVLGHNDRVAWGATNLKYDVQDLYIEKLDPATGAYLFRGRTEQARNERDVIAVKRGKPVELAQWVTRHGPVLLSDAGQHLALRWVAAEPDGFGFPFLDIDRARDWEEFTTALARYPGPAQNFVYADVDGNIGYQAAGKFPIRKTYDGDLPVDGSSGNYEWEGYIPFERLPRVYNPPSGIIVTANQNPFSESWPYRLHGAFDANYRAAAILARLTSRAGWRAEEMLAVQTDVYSAFSHFLAQQVVTACGRRRVTNPALTDAVALLRVWNGQMEKGTAAPFIVTLLYQHLRRAVVERAAPGKGLVYESSMAPAVLEKLLRERPREWFPDYDQLLVRMLDEALEEGRRMQGRDVRKWDFGRYNQLRLAHPLASAVPLVGNYFQIGPIGQSGSSTTIKQTTRRLGPSMRLAADLSDWDKSRLNLLTGESGQVLSSHYKDQWDAYYNGHGFPMPFTKVEARDTLEVTPPSRP